MDKPTETSSLDRASSAGLSSRARGGLASNDGLTLVPDVGSVPALAARRAHASDPEWVPLLEIAGDHSRDFMWMARITLEDGTEIEAYKHRQTRRYLHLSAEGVAYEYLPPAYLGDRGLYQRSDRRTALEQVFVGWHELNAGAPDFEEMDRELTRVLASARSGQRTSFDPEWLVRQQRFEAAVDRARNYEREADPNYRGVQVAGDDFVGDLADC